MGVSGLSQAVLLWDSRGTKLLHHKETGANEKSCERSVADISGSPAQPRKYCSFSVRIMRNSRPFDPVTPSSRVKV